RFDLFRPSGTGGRRQREGIPSAPRFPDRRTHGRASAASISPRRNPPVYGRIAGMSTQKQRMLGGELYRDSDPELVAERRACQKLLDRFNETKSGDEAQRRDILENLLGAVGEGSWIMPRFQCDYGYLIE